MSWLRSSFFSNFLHNRTYICTSLYNDIRLSQRQQFSCLSKAHKQQLLAFKYKRVKEPSFSVLGAIQQIKPMLYSFLKQFSKNWKAYLPIYSSLWYKYYGYAWYKTLDEIDVQQFLRAFDMEDTFFSRFNVIELHVWMLLFHLPKDGKINNFIITGVIEAMWKDSEDRGKLMEKFNPNFRKNFRKLSNKFQVTLFLYDYAYLKNDAVLSSALWYNYFDRKYIDPRTLERLVEYIRYQMQNLSTLNFEALMFIEDKTEIWKPLQFVK